MVSDLSFPTKLHQDSAELIRDYFLAMSNVDTVLVVNSCARGKAVPESDLDFAILVKPDTTPAEIKNIEQAWRIYSEKQPTLPRNCRTANGLQVSPAPTGKRINC